MAGLVTAAPLVAVKSGQAASLEDGIRQELQGGMLRGLASMMVLGLVHITASTKCSPAIRAPIARC